MIFKIYNDLSVPVFVFDNNGRQLLFKNTKAKIFLREIKSSGTSLDSLLKKAVTKFLCSEESGSECLEFDTSNGKKWYEFRYSSSNVEGKDVVLLELIDVTLQHISEQKVMDVFRFRDLVYKIVEKNNNISIFRIPDLIQESLELVGHFFDCDRSYVCVLDQNLKKISKVAEWNRGDLRSYSGEEDMDYDSVGWSLDKIFNDGLLLVNSIEDLPEEAVRERRLMKEWNVQSYLILPIDMQSGYRGYLGVEFVNRQKRWSDFDINNLKFVTRSIDAILLRYSSETNLQEKEMLYQSLFMSANDSILIFKNGECIDCNEKALELFRCKKDDLIGVRGEDLSAEDKKNIMKKISEHLFEKNEAVYFVNEYLIKRPDGSKFYANVSLSRLLINDNSYVIAIYRDVSKEKQTFKKLKERENFLRNKLEQLLAPAKNIQDFTIRDLFDVNQLQVLQDALVDAFGISSYIADEKGVPVTIPTETNNICKLISATEKGKKMCHETAILLKEKAGYVTSEKISCKTCGFIDAFSPIIVDGKYIGSWIIGQVIPEGYAKEDLKKYIGPLGVDVARAEQLFDIMPKIDVNKFQKILNLLSVLSNELSTLGYNNLKLAKTIKEHIILEKELREAKNKAEESDRLKSAFLANLSHEIRTPMNGIIGFADLLDDENITKENHREFLALIKQSSNQLLNIINDIIDISKIEAGQVDVKKREFDVDELFRELDRFFKRSAEEKGIGLILETGGSGETVIVTDEVKLRQVLTNLLSNAIKFTDSGYVKFGYSLSSGELKIFVEDTGTGIDEGGIEKIFDRFWQSRRNSPGKGGTGLGLAITKAYVEILGGTIDISSKLSEGTTFTVKIPVGTIS